MVECGGWIEKSHSLRKAAALESGDTTADTSASHLTNITDAQSISTNDVQLLDFVDVEQ